jgi:hypothetical protein
LNIISLSLIGVLAWAAGATAATPTAGSVTLVQDPLVMRLNKDEFRIAFGIKGERCTSNGCNGSIHYRVYWQTLDGTARSEIRQVSYTVSPGAARTIAVDRQFFDTGEGEHTTDVVRVSIDMITCLDGVNAVTAGLQPQGQ